MFGSRWAGAIGGGWLLIFAALTALRWLGGGGSGGHEQIVEVPVPPQANIGTGKEVTAPDPGDNP